VLAQGIVEDADVVPGKNQNVNVKVLWDPIGLSKEKGRAVGRELVSQYLSGWLLSSNKLYISNIYCA
jgi:hypothetical protein